VTAEPQPSSPSSAPSPESQTFQFGLFAPELRADPYPGYHLLRAWEPVHQPFPGIWILTRYADAAAVLRDPRMGSDFRRSEAYREFVESMGQAFVEREPSMLFTDPPDHTRLRALVNSAFSARVVEGLRPRIRELAEELVDAAAERGQMDVVADLAYPLPVTVICEMLGVPRSDHGRFTEWSADMVQTLDPVVPPDLIQRAEAADTGLREYFRGLIAERRRDPGQDLLDALMAAEEDGDRLTEEELLTMLILLLVAGHETTVNLISNGTLALLRNAPELERMRADPSIERSAVEELLRYDSPVQMIGRIPTEDVQIDGRPIQAGEQIAIIIGAANRDPAQFPEPDRLDLTRADNRHLAFGSGIHFCLGASLARAEGQAAIGTLVRRLPELRLDGEPEWRETITLRGLKRLPVAFGA
jgi:cytochrome P450